MDPALPMKKDLLQDLPVFREIGLLEAEAGHPREEILQDPPAGKEDYLRLPIMVIWIATIYKDIVRKAPTITNLKIILKIRITVSDRIKI